MVVVGGTVVLVGAVVVVGAVVGAGVGTVTGFVGDDRRVAVADGLPQALKAAAGRTSTVAAVSHPRRVGTGQW